MASYEHALFLLLLLGYLLRDLPGRHQAYLYLITGGLLLVLLTPLVSIPIPWQLIFALVLPWIFWLNARSWLHIERFFPRKEVYLWFITVICLVLIAVFIGDLPWLRAIFFGIVVASMLWHASSRVGIPNPFENLGPLALVFLLVETSLALDAPRLYVGSLFSGAGIGIALALLSINLSKKVPAKYMGWISLGQVYLAYWISLAIGASAIAAALVSVVVYTEFCQRRSDIQVSIISPALLDDRLTFFAAFSLFITIAWQIHQPATPSLWIEGSLGFCIGFLIASLGQRWGLPRFEILSSTWHTGLKLGLFLFGTLILWPRGSELGPAMILIAFGTAILMPILTTTLIEALKDLRARWDEHPADDY
jgi:hypothetical protein